MTLCSTIGFSVCLLLLTAVVQLLRKDIKNMSDSVVALTNAINAYTAAVNAKLGTVAQQVTAAVTAAQAEDKTAIDALTAQIQAATSAIG